jgi:hypothetical protein
MGSCVCACERACTCVGVGDVCERVCECWCVCGVDGWVVGDKG